MNPPPCCARCASWLPEPTVTLRAGRAGSLWGWCEHKKSYLCLKNESINGTYSECGELGLRTRAETVCPLYVRS
jgi:hypothetical protein